MAKSADTDIAPASTVELPPNKAIAATGSAGIGAIVVGLGIYYFAPDTPPHIVALWDALASMLSAGVTTYFTPHGAVLKKDH